MESKLKPPTKPIRLRGNDPTGHGYFGASRSGGRRKHNGTDYCTNVGERIYAPQGGTVRIGYPYRGKTAMKLVAITSGKIVVKVMYVEPTVRNGQIVKAGDLIGTAQDIAKYHNSSKMKNHVHVEITDNGVLVNPEDVIK